MSTFIVDYKLNLQGIFVKNDNFIILLGYKVNYGDYDQQGRYIPSSQGYYAPRILKSHDGGKTWKLKSFPSSEGEPRFFVNGEAIILYNFESEGSNAFVYLSSDWGESWNQIGEQELFYEESPVFGDLTIDNPDVKQIHKVRISDDVFADESPSQTTFTVKNKDPALPFKAGYINRFDGESILIDIGDYRFSSTVMFIDNNDPKDVWVLGEYSENSGDYDAIALIHSSDNGIVKIASWPSETSAKFGGDYPRAIFVSDKIIAVAVAGAPMYGRGILRYSTDQGRSWKKKILQDSRIISISYDDIENTLNVACANVIEFSYLKIPIALSTRPE